MPCWAHWFRGIISFGGRSHRDRGETDEIDDVVEVLEAAFLQHARRHVVLEVSVVEPEPQAVEPKPREEARVVGAKEVLEEAVEEEVVPLLPEGPEHRRA